MISLLAGSVEVWKCGSVEVWKCGSKEVWKSGNMQVILYLSHIYLNLEVRKGGSLEILKYANDPLPFSHLF